MGCVYSFNKSGNNEKCPFCNANQDNKTNEERVGEVMRRVEANDAASIYVLGSNNYQGLNGFQQDHAKGLELLARAADLGYSKARHNLATIYYQRGDLKKAKFHYEAAALWQ
jgi:TPR repeat protein